MKAKGVYFDGKESKGELIRAETSGKELRLLNLDDELISAELIEHIRIEPPLGNTRRRIRLKDGGLLETGDTTLISQLESQRKTSRVLQVIHKLESCWSMAVVALLLLVIVTAGFFRLGIPRLADLLAHAAPPDTLDRISQETVDYLDKSFLDPSSLASLRKETARRQFNQLPKHGDFDYQLIFRKGGPIGANALALPSGTIIVTDELFDVLQNDDELKGVFLHEIAHIDQRHGLRKILQESGAFLLLSFLAGDILPSASVVAALPALLIETGYSRRFEEEADQQAAKSLHQLGKSTMPLQQALIGLSAHSQSHSHQQSRIFGWIATHPATADRIESLRAFDSNQ